MPNKNLMTHVLSLSFFLLPCAGLAQVPTMIETTADDAPAPRAGTSPPAVARLNDGSLQLRYRLQTNASGEVTHETLQGKALFDVTIAFFGDRVRLDLQAGTGDTFDGSWSHLGAGGTHERQIDFHLRRISLAYDIHSRLQVALGSFGPRYGAGSEGSYFDSDGYITGYRAQVKIEGGDLVVTAGFVGDYGHPSVGGHLGRMDELNYLQAVLTRRIGGIVHASVDYTRLAGEDYARGAVSLDLSSWTELLDSVTVEGMSGLGREERGRVLATKLSKKFAELLGDRDLQASVVYSHRSDDLDLLLGDKIWKGHTVRATFLVPRSLRLGDHATLDAGVDVVQSLTDLERLRTEFYMSLRF
jgi:hypothetical protein